MARVNIEDSLFTDHRFLNLVVKTNSLTDALGILVWAFIIAQKHFLNEENDRLIPHEDWKRQNLSDLLIEVGLAQVREKGVYICGSEKQFSWLLQRVNAGKRGGLSRSTKASIAESVGTNPDQAVAKRSLDGRQAVAKPLSLSLSLSQIQIQENNKSKSISAVVENQPPAPADRRSQVFIINRDTKDPDQTVINRLGPHTLQRWSELYPDQDFLTREIKKAVGYYLDNPSKIPKSVRGWSRALSSWLERGWNYRARTVKGQAGKVNISDLLSEDGK